MLIQVWQINLMYFKKTLYRLKMFQCLLFLNFKDFFIQIQEDDAIWYIFSRMERMVQQKTKVSVQRKSCSSRISTRFTCIFSATIWNGWRTDVTVSGNHARKIKQKESNGCKRMKLNLTNTLYGFGGGRFRPRRQLTVIKVGNLNFWTKVRPRYYTCI